MNFIFEYKKNTVKIITGNTCLAIFNIIEKLLSKYVAIQSVMGILLFVYFERRL